MNTSLAYGTPSYHQLEDISNSADQDLQEDTLVDEHTKVSLGAGAGLFDTDGCSGSLGNTKLPKDYFAQRTIQRGHDLWLELNMLNLSNPMRREAF